MNPLIQFKTTILPLLMAAVLGCFGVAPMAQAVVPAPDGGYPGFNTAEGQNALFSLTTGTANTAVGWSSLFSNTDGAFNTGVGAGTLLFNIGDQANFDRIENTAIGAAALLFNTIGLANTATGAFALNSNTEGNYNTATGDRALFSNTAGGQNTATGFRALFSNTTGGQNTGVGVGALTFDTTGSMNTATGFRALTHNTDGDRNTASGSDALFFNTTGDFNTATGVSALTNNTTGEENTANGASALVNNTTGTNNTAVGTAALGLNTTGSFNVALGDAAGLQQTTGSDNIYIGWRMEGVAGESHACYIGNIFPEPSAGGIPVLINSSHKLGVTTSSERFKKDIKPMDNDSEALLRLKPVTFRYKQDIDPDRRGQFGLVAEEVEKVNPDLVVRDKEGKPYSVRYDQVNAMLLNEFLKEHTKVEEQDRRLHQQGAMIAEQQKQIQALTAGLQKVSAQMELTKAAPQTVKNND